MDNDYKPKKSKLQLAQEDYNKYVDTPVTFKNLVTGDPAAADQSGSVPQQPQLTPEQTQQMNMRNMQARQKALQMMGGMQSPDDLAKQQNTGIQQQLQDVQDTSQFDENDPDRNQQNQLQIQRLRSLLNRK